MTKKLTKAERALQARLKREKKLQDRRFREIQDRFVIGPDGKARPEPAGKSLFEDDE